MGTREAGFASCLPGYRKFENADDRAELAALWNVPVERDSRRRAAWPIPTSSKRRSTSKIRALWIIAHQSDRVVPEPRRRCSRRSKASSSSSCRTASIPTPTSELADLVLPAAIWGEKEGTYTNSERRVSKVNRAVDSARRGALRLRHLPRPRRARSACRDELFPGWTTRRATPSRNGSASRRAGSATTRA